jgi:hypothetical protein
MLPASPARASVSDSCTQSILSSRSSRTTAMDGRDTDPGPAAAQVELLASTPPRFKENADDCKVRERSGDQ